jgi:ADP-heptose:LPS heptosyltransferase
MGRAGEIGLGCAGFAGPRPTPLLWDDRRTRWPSLVKALWRTRLGRFDTALDLQGISKAGLFLGATRAARRVSYESARRISRWSSTEQVPEPTPLHAAPGVSA